MDQRYDSNGFLFEGRVFVAAIDHPLRAFTDDLLLLTPLSEYCGPSLPALISC